MIRIPNNVIRFIVVAKFSLENAYPDKLHNHRSIFPTYTVSYARSALTTTETARAIDIWPTTGLPVLSVDNYC